MTNFCYADNIINDLKIKLETSLKQGSIDLNDFEHVTQKFPIKRKPNYYRLVEEGSDYVLLSENGLADPKATPMVVYWGLTVLKKQDFVPHRAVRIVFPNGREVFSFVNAEHQTDFKALTGEELYSFIDKDKIPESFWYTYGDGKADS